MGWGRERDEERPRVFYMLPNSLLITMIVPMAAAAATCADQSWPFENNNRRSHGKHVCCDQVTSPLGRVTRHTLPLRNERR